MYYVHYINICIRVISFCYDDNFDDDADEEEDDDDDDDDHETI